MTETEELLLKWEKKRSEAKGGFDVIQRTLNPHSIVNQVMQDTIEILDLFIKDLKILSNSK